jgi:hypothetical protein
MSQCFRPVKEVWNSHSSCFVESKALITLLHDLAARVGTASDEHNYGDNIAVWLEDGSRVLDYIETDRRFNAESFKDSLEEQGLPMNTDEVSELAALLHNMRSLASQWRNSSGERGELVFYIDACSRVVSWDSGTFFPQLAPKFLTLQV